MWVSVLTAVMPRIGIAQAGPPFFRTIPYAGQRNWEINLAAAQTIERAGASYQLPQIDLNFGIGTGCSLPTKSRMCSKRPTLDRATPAGAMPIRE